MSGVHDDVNTLQILPSREIFVHESIPRLNLLLGCESKAVSRHVDDPDATGDIVKVQ